MEAQPGEVLEVGLGHAVETLARYAKPWRHRAMRLSVSQICFICPRSRSRFEAFFRALERML